MTNLLTGLLPEFDLHKIRNHPASGNTKYKVCSYVPKKVVFLPEEGIATSSSMPRRIVSRKETPQHVEHADVWVSC